MEMRQTIATDTSQRVESSLGTVGDQFSQTQRIAEMIFGKRIPTEGPGASSQTRALPSTVLPNFSTESASTSDAKRDSNWYQPSKRTLAQPDETEHGRFLELLTFISDPISTAPYQDLNLDDSTWRYELSAYPTTNSKLFKDAYGGTGYRYEGGLEVRTTAAEKAIAYFRAINRGHPDRKKPRRYILEEGEPCRSVLEGGRWADKVKTLDNHLLLKKFGSHVTIVVDCKASAYVANGHYTYWYTCLRELITKYPDNISVVIRDASLLTADRTPYLPERTMADIIRVAEREYTEQYFVQRVGYEPSDDPSRKRYLQLYDEAISNEWNAQEERRERIVENFKHVEQFIEQARSRSALPFN